MRPTRLRLPGPLELSALAMLLHGCATPEGIIPPPLDLPKKVSKYSELQATQAGRSERVATTISATPKPPPAERTDTVKRAPQAEPAQEEASISLAFDQAPLPTLIQAVYGTMLRKNVNIDQKIADRRDLVTLRSGGLQTPAQVENTMRLLLKSYGIAVTSLDGLTRITPDNSNLGYSPEIRRGRALPETPLPMRPVFQLVELNAVRQAEVSGWIKAMFGEKVKLQEDPSRNAVLLSGQSTDLLAALEAIQVLDQPLMRGRQSVRITPAFWSAEELSKKLTEILQAEGYSVTMSSAPGAISLLPVPSANALIAFAGSPAILDHVGAWVRDIDKPSERGGGRNIFSYQVQYTDADLLAKTLDKLLAGITASSAKPAASGTSAPATRVVVDGATNTLIFQGSSEDYGQIRNLLQSLDKPARQTLIEITVAEVSLTDDTSLGVEWLLKEARVDGTKIVAGTLGGTAIGSGGFNYKRVDSVGDTRLLINALASTNRATILSTPRILARTGETASIQVGNEVPFITSQQTNPTTGTSGSLLQTVQYRNTGSVLRVKPVVHSGDQIDLDVSQEVSEAQATNTGVNNSPTISSRRLETRLSIKNGSTVLLGGLISRKGEGGSSGIPGLKDVPVLGHLFKSDFENEKRTELIVLITAYVIADDSDAQAVTAAFRRQLGGWAQNAAKPTPAAVEAPAPTLPPSVEPQAPAQAGATADANSPSAASSEANDQPQKEVMQAPSAPPPTEPSVAPKSGGAPELSPKAPAATSQATTPSPAPTTDKQWKYDPAAEREAFEKQVLEWTTGDKNKAPPKKAP